MSLEIRNTMIVGAVIATIGFLGGQLVTILGMMKSFRGLGGDEIVDPKALAVGITEAVAATTGGLILGSIGLLIVMVEIIRMAAAGRKNKQVAQS